MPVVFRAGSFRLFFYANEGSPREPPHVHVEQGDREAKFGFARRYVWPTMTASMLRLSASYWG